MLARPLSSVVVNISDLRHSRAAPVVSLLFDLPVEKGAPLPPVMSLAPGLFCECQWSALRCLCEHWPTDVEIALFRHKLFYIPQCEIDAPTLRFGYMP